MVSNARALQPFALWRLTFVLCTEMHGFNRDSRSRRLNLTNAQVLAKAMNALQASMTAVDPKARSLFWGDMLSPWHNGARPGYQLGSGGVEGATYLAMPLLDKRIIIMPWCT